MSGDSTIFEQKAGYTAEHYMYLEYGQIAQVMSSLYDSIVSIMLKSRELRLFPYHRNRPKPACLPGVGHCLALDSVYGVNLDNRWYYSEAAQLE